MLPRRFTRLMLGSNTLIRQGRVGKSRAGDGYGDRTRATGQERDQGSLGKRRARRCRLSDSNTPLNSVEKSSNLEKVQARNRSRYGSDRPDYPVIAGAVCIARSCGHDSDMTWLNHAPPWNEVKPSLGRPAAGRRQPASGSAQHPARPSREAGSRPSVSGFRADTTTAARCDARTPPPRRRSHGVRTCRRVPCVRLCAHRQCPAYVLPMSCLRWRHDRAAGPQGPAISAAACGVRPAPRPGPASPALAQTAAALPRPFPPPSAAQWAHLRRRPYGADDPGAQRAP